MRRVLCTLFILALICLAASTVSGQSASKHPVPMHTADCLSCHERSSPALVKEWFDSAHGMTGVTCATCHGDADNFSAKPPVQSCRGCHSSEVATAPKERNCVSCHTTHSFRTHRVHYLR